MRVLRNLFSGLLVLSLFVASMTLPKTTVASESKIEVLDRGQFVNFEDEEEPSKRRHNLNEADGYDAKKGKKQTARHSKKQSKNKKKRITNRRNL